MNEINSERLIIEETVPIKSKVSFGLTYFGSGLMSGLGLGPIVYYYNTILGLNEFWSSLAWIIFMTWNAINDPLLGFLEDRTRSKKYDRRIPYLRFGAPVYTILFILC